MAIKQVSSCGIIARPIGITTHNFMSLRMRFLKHEQMKAKTCGSEGGRRDATKHCLITANVEFAEDFRGSVFVRRYRKHVSKGLCM